MKNVTVLSMVRVCWHPGKQPLCVKGDKTLGPAALSRLPISSCNYTANCFSFTSVGTMNGLEAEGRLAH